MHIQRKAVEDLANLLDRSCNELREELDNERPIKTNFVFANLMELNKGEVISQCDKVISVLNQIKKLKEFNPKNNKP